MKILVLILMVVLAHFSLTAFAPAPSGKDTWYWPFAADSKPWLGFIGGLPQQSGSIVTPLLAGVGGLAFLAAAMSWMGWIVPAVWFRPLAIGAPIASMLLYLVYFGWGSLIPLALDAIMLWGLVVQQGAMAGLRG